MRWLEKATSFLLIACFTLAGGCVTLTTPSTPTPTKTATYNIYQLKYRLFSQFDAFWCDPHFWPVVRPDQERDDAVLEFPSIQANGDEFNPILSYLGLEVKSSYTAEEKVLIFRQHKKLDRAVQMTASGDGYNFVLREGEGQGWLYEGTITSQGNVTIDKKEVSINTCPICLAAGTLIDTPDGPVPVENLRPGMSVWTLDSSNNRIATRVKQTSRTEVPADFQVVKVLLDDGRQVSTSGTHPSASGKMLGDYRLGDVLDGALVVSVENVDYMGGVTCDLLPEGETGCYWANGILLRSTLGQP